MDKFIFMVFYWGLGAFLLSSVCFLALVTNVAAKKSVTLRATCAMAASVVIGLLGVFVVFAKGPGSEQPKLAQAIKADDLLPEWLTSFQ